MGLKRDFFRKRETLLGAIAPLGFEGRLIFSADHDPDANSCGYGVSGFRSTWVHPRFMRSNGQLGAVGVGAYINAATSSAIALGSSRSDRP